MAGYFSAQATLFMSSILMTSLECVWSCHDCENSMRNEIDKFYDFPDLTRNTIQPLGPCSNEGNAVAKFKRSVFVPEPWMPERSSCPWEHHFDEDLYGIRYPCRLYTARLRSNATPQRCYRRPGHLSPRRDNQFCEPLLQNAPVLIKVGCQQGCNLYERRNFTMTVGFTCVMHQR